MKRLLAFMFGALLLAVPAVALAFSAQSGQDVTVPKGQLQTGTFYTAGQTVTVDGDINGDLICAGNSVTVNGTVHGDVICGGQTITINGPVDGSVRLAGQVVSINNTVGRNATIAAQTVSLGGSGHITGDFGALAQTASVDGPVDKDLYGALGNLTMSSTTGAVTVAANSVSLTGTARVNGDLHYSAAQPLSFDKSKVTGSITYSNRPTHHNNNWFAKGILGLAFYWILAGWVVGLALVWAAPKLVRRITDTMLERTGGSIGWGLVVTFLTPFLIVLLFITLVGLPLGLLMMILWGLMLATSALWASISAGAWILSRLDWNKGSLLWATLIGVPLVAILFSLPFIGELCAILATWWAVGGLSLSANPLRA